MGSNARNVRNLYIRVGDEELWDRAAVAAKREGVSLSAKLTQLMRPWVEESETRARQLAKILRDAGMD